MYIQQVQQQYSEVQHSTAHSPRVDVLCMQYSKYSRYSRYSSTAQYSKVDVPPELCLRQRRVGQYAVECEHIAYYIYYIILYINMDHIIRQDNMVVIM